MINLILYLKRNDDGTEIHMNGIEPVGYKYPFKDSNLLPVYEPTEMKKTTTTTLAKNV